MVFHHCLSQSVRLVLKIPRTRTSHFRPSLAPFLSLVYILALEMGTFFSSRIISFGRGPLPINLITTTQKEKNPFVTYKTINIHVHIYFFIREMAQESIQ